MRFFDYYYYWRIISSIKIFHYSVWAPFIEEAFVQQNGSVFVRGLYYDIWQILERRLNFTTILTKMKDGKFAFIFKIFTSKLMILSFYTQETAECLFTLHSRSLDSFKMCFYFQKNFTATLMMLSFYSTPNKQLKICLHFS